MSVRRSVRCITGNGQRAPVAERPVALPPAAVWGVAAMSIRSFIQSFAKPEMFGPEAIEAMSEGLAAALRELNEGGGPPKLVIEVVAQRIIAAASNGERDPVLLRKAALAALPGEED